MLEGIPPRAATDTISANATKRRRVAGGLEGSFSGRSGGLQSAGKAPSRRIAVTNAPPSHLPDLPPLPPKPNEEEGQEHREQRREAEAVVPSGPQMDGEGHEEVRAGVFRCKGGVPCDDVYCSTGCRESALAAGHGLICIGGSEEGR